MAHYCNCKREMTRPIPTNYWTRDFVISSLFRYALDTIMLGIILVGGWPTVDPLKPPEWSVLAKFAIPPVPHVRESKDALHEMISAPSMKTIYHLLKNRQLIADAQAASLSPKPFGLTTTHGLFGSDQW